MTEKEKQLLLKDICARLPYEVKCNINFNQKDGMFLTELLQGVLTDCISVKPYLRPMSSMTDEERKEYESFIFIQHHEWDGHGTSTKYVEADDAERYVTWLNKKMFDYRGLIPMGLALEAPKDMYKID